MPTDYVLFVHGVKTRSRSEFEQLATTLLSRIQANITDRSRQLKPIFFFWGDLNLQPQQELLRGLKASSQWPNFWFQDFRTEQVLEFVGDAALYLSRHVGSQVVRRFRTEALGTLQGGDQDDRLHLVTHSWGTVILFDILFARRWEDPALDGEPATHDIRAMVQDIRGALFGLPDKSQSDPQLTIRSGIPIASIHTMGSPLALFSLLSISGVADGASTHDLTPLLKELLQQLFSFRKNKPLPWCNFAHPGDPIAYPLEGVLPLMLDGNAQYVTIRDMMTDRGNILNRPFSQKLVPLLWGGEAHNSYWNNAAVANTISQVIRSTVSA